ncbi:MAG: PilZ domain-containing protein [Candidatus Omnitrophica bacterium]|nr:PilZ domain-containing protein [Candidatus Omnitrophota bacterium]
MPIKERRKFFRIATELEAEYWAKGPSMVSGQAKVRDFCREGLGVLLPRQLEQGEHVDFTFRVPGDNVPIFATAQVTWTRDARDRAGIGAGLRLLSMKPLDLARMLDFVYSKWLGGVKESL